MNGSSISPAPCAVAIRNDHHASRVGRIRASARGWRRSISLKMPNSTTSTPAPMRIARLHSTYQLSHANGTSTTAIAAKCPPPSGSTVANTALPRRAAMPLATASGHPIAGLSP